MVWGGGCHLEMGFGGWWRNMMYLGDGMCKGEEWKNRVVYEDLGVK
jgi:hypothetical protein